MTIMICTTWQAHNLADDARLEVELLTLADVLEAEDQFVEVDSYEADDHIVWRLYTVRVDHVPYGLWSRRAEAYFVDR